MARRPENSIQLARPSLVALGALALALALTPVPAAAQTPAAVRTGAALDFGAATQVVLPGSRGFALHRGQAPVIIERVEARVRVTGRVARTTLQVHLANPGARQEEAVVLLPVVAGAAVSSFDFQGAGFEPSAKLLPAEEARRVYDEIVARVRDPALLEFAGYGWVRSSVFPVPAGGTQVVRLGWDEVLGREGQRVDWLLPRSEALERRVPWNVSVSIDAGQPVTGVYSPSHAFVTRRLDARRWELTLADEAMLEPGALRLSWLLEGDAPAASLFAYPDVVSGGGYYLLFAGAPHSKPPAVRREVTLVLDRSGSMAGGKLQQAAAAALQVIEGLGADERFAIVDYATGVSRLFAEPQLATPANVARARQYLAALRPGGGTNLHDALHEALAAPALADLLPLVLFLTDGLPTVGRMRESEIAALVDAANPAQRRVFCFGVGIDVNVPLLDRLSEDTRAVASYVLPGEDVEVAVASVFRKLAGPALADLSLVALGPHGAEDPSRLFDRAPSRLPDLFADDGLVILGRYRGNHPLHLRLSGTSGSQTHVYEVAFDTSRASTRHAFVPRLWAARRVSELVDAIRRAGADQVTYSGRPPPLPDLRADPKLAELVDEILRLSTEFGILTEYTSFLAREGTDLSRWEPLLAACSAELGKKAVGMRSGAAAVSQGVNYNRTKVQSFLNASNRMMTEDLQEVSVTSVQQVADRAFYLRDGRWVDSRLVAAGKGLQPDEVVTFGSERHHELVRKYAAEGRAACLSLAEPVLLAELGKNVLVVPEGR